MGNILAITRKEFRSYFASPIAYVVIGMFALVYGFMFDAVLGYFLRNSQQMGAMGGGGMNINQMIVRPLFGNVSVILLILVPMITMRSFSEEKATGTIELLLTSPITDWQLVLGKFFGAMSLVATMLLITLVDVAILFVYGNPEWRLIGSAYLGFLLMTGCFVALGLFVSSMTKSQVVAAVATFSTFLLLWVLNWMADAGGPTVNAIIRALSITDHLDDFTKGVIDTKHLVYYVSFISFGLFLTAKSVDAERWRG